MVWPQDENCCSILTRAKLTQWYALLGVAPVVENGAESNSSSWMRDVSARSGDVKPSVNSKQASKCAPANVADGQGPNPMATLQQKANPMEASQHKMIDPDVGTEYWRKLDKLRPHRTFAMRYIQTLDKFLTKTHQEISTAVDQEKSDQLKKKRKVAENVRKYLWLLCRLCTDSQNKRSGLPPNMRLLEVIQKTLDAVYKRQRMPDAKNHNEELHTRRQTNHRHAVLGEFHKEKQYTAGRALVNPRPNAMKLSYDDTVLNWNLEHTANEQEKYCYCGTNKQEACLQCTVCKNWFHKGCCTVLASQTGTAWVDFMLNYRFTCKICNAHDNKERFELTKCSWLESILGGFHHLTATTGRDMFKAAEITNHLDEHWDALCHQRERGDNKKWRNSLNSYLTNNMKKFERPKKFFWSLANPSQDPRGPRVQPCHLLQAPALPAPEEPKKTKIAKSKHPKRSNREPSISFEPAVSSSVWPLSHVPPEGLFGRTYSMEINSMLTNAVDADSTVSDTPWDTSGLGASGMTEGGMNFDDYDFDAAYGPGLDSSSLVNPFAVQPLTTPSEVGMFTVKPTHEEEEHVPTFLPVMDADVGASDGTSQRIGTVDLMPHVSKRDRSPDTMSTTDWQDRPALSRFKVRIAVVSCA